MSLAELVDRARVIVSLGPGGVGKTTTAAAVALKAARSGRRTLVCTIDPARRLASSLGISELGDDPHHVDPARFSSAGLPRCDTLWAMMLDQKAALDKLVLAEADDPEIARQLKDNLMYQVLTRDMPGMHEYAAISRLYELAESGEWDLIVLDTPPTTHALDFLDAPSRLITALESPVVQWLIKPYLKAGQLSLKLLGGARALILRRVARIVGTGLLERIAEFLVLFQGVLDGVRKRNEAVNALLKNAGVKYMVVTAPQYASAREARTLMKQLHQRGLGAAALIMNRVHRSDGAMPPEDLRARLEAAAGASITDQEAACLVEELGATHHHYQRLAQADRVQLERLLSGLPTRPATATIPLLGEDVYDLVGLSQISDFL